MKLTREKPSILSFFMKKNKKMNVFYKVLISAFFLVIAVISYGQIKIEKALIGQWNLEKTVAKYWRTISHLFQSQTFSVYVFFFHFTLICLL